MTVSLGPIEAFIVGFVFPRHSPNESKGRRICESLVVVSNMGNFGSQVKLVKVALVSSLAEEQRYRIGHQ